MKKNRCIGCSKKIYPENKRCRNCWEKFMVGKNNPNYKNGNCLKKAYCINCRKKLSNLAHYKGYKRCCSCANRIIGLKRKLTTKHKENISKAHKQNWKNPKYAQKRLRFKTPNKIEQRLDLILQQLLPNEYKYVGDGKIIIGGFCPDFINCNSQKKIIELFGDYWHNLPTYKKRDKGRLYAYNRYGYETLIMWEHELNDITKLRKRIIQFNATC